MELSERVKDHFSHSIQISTLIADSLANEIAHAGQILVSSILHGKKILSCGSGGAAALSNYFSTQLLHNFSMELPALPAISLSGDSATLTSIANDKSFRYAFSQQITALGQSEDVLLCINTSGNSESIVESIKAAHENNMHIISLTGKDGGKIHDMYRLGDIEIRIPSEQVICIHEGQLMVINCLCEAINHSLFGV